MTRFLSNRDGGKTDEKGHLKFLHSSTWGDVWSGGNTTQNGTPNMTVNVAAIDALIRDTANGYAYQVWSDAVENVQIPTANASNGRKDYLIAYVDRAVTPQTANANNSGIMKFIIVAGTPAGSPVYPTVSQIQASAVGTNPYIIIAGISVAAATTTITDAAITDLRNFAYTRRPAGAVDDFAGGTVPDGYLLCYGQTVSRSTYDRLFKAIGVTWGAGDGSTTFAVPDLRGRTTAGADAMGGTAANRLTNQSGGVAGTVGAVGGAQTHTLALTQIPNVTGGIGLHSGERGSSFTSGSGVFAGSTTAAGYIAPNGTNSASSSIYNNINFSLGGGGQAHNNVQPTAVVNKMIAY